MDVMYSSQDQSQKQKHKGMLIGLTDIFHLEMVSCEVKLFATSYLMQTLDWISRDYIDQSNQQLS